MTEWHLGKVRHRSVGTEMETDIQNQAHTEHRNTGQKYKKDTDTACRQEQRESQRTKTLTLK